MTLLLLKHGYDAAHARTYIHIHIHNINMERDIDKIKVLINWVDIRIGQLSVNEASHPWSTLKPYKEYIADFIYDYTIGYNAATYNVIFNSHSTIAYLMEIVKTLLPLVDELSKRDIEEYLKRLARIEDDVCKHLAAYLATAPGEGQ